MKQQSTQNTNTGMTFSGMLGIVFIILKLTGVIDWAWVWVLAPLWIPLAVAVVFVIIWIVVQSIGGN